MARLGLNDVAAMPDPLLGYQFEWHVPNIPGSGDGQGLTLRCRSASIPGEQKEPVEVTLHGVTLEYLGRTIFNHEMPLQFVETRDIFVITKLKNWLSYSRNIRTTTGSYKSQYATTSFLYLFDDTQQIVQTIKLRNSCIKSMDDVALDGSSSTPVEISASLQYDWTELYAGQA